MDRLHARGAQAAAIAARPADARLVTEEAALLARVSPKAFRAFARSRAIPHVRIGRRLSYRHADVKAALDEATAR